MSKTTPRVATRLMLSAVVILTLSMGYFCSVDVFAHPSKKTSIQELSSQEKLEAEQRLWDLGYWAGIVDGKFDSDSQHALIAFQKVEH